jgi:hypothetical protein
MPSLSPKQSMLTIEVDGKVATPIPMIAAPFRLHRICSRRTAEVHRSWRLRNHAADHDPDVARAVKMVRNQDAIGPKCRYGSRRRRPMCGEDRRTLGRRTLGGALIGMKGASPAAPASQKTTKSSAFPCRTPAFQARSVVHARYRLHTRAVRNSCPAFKRLVLFRRLHSSPAASGWSGRRVGSRGRLKAPPFTARQCVGFVSAIGDVTGSPFLAIKTAGFQ